MKGFPSYGWLAVLVLIGTTSCNQDPTLPAFGIQLLDSGSSLNTADVPKGNPVAVVYFSPDCSHCQKETEDILKHMDSLRGVRFLFVCLDPMDRLRVFNLYYKIYRYPNITLGRDTAFFIPKYYEAQGPPLMAVYDGRQRLKKIFAGEVTARELIQTLQEQP